MNGNQQKTLRQLQQNLQEMVCQLQLVSEKVDSMNGGLQATVGFDAHQTFVCGSCSSRGHVATRLTCTSCGEENWWGWFPQQG